MNRSMEDGNIGLISYGKRRVNDIIQTTAEALGHGHGHDIWESVLRIYCECSLTFPTDKLTALMGNADGISARTGMTFVAGLWKELLFLGLSWYVGPRYRKSNRSHRMGTNGLSPSIEARPSTKISSGAPTWSWASVNGNIRFDRDKCSVWAKSIAELVHLDVVPKVSNPTPEPEGRPQRTYPSCIVTRTEMQNWGFWV
jgi:hypothetical protein